MFMKNLKSQVKNKLTMSVFFHFWYLKFRNFNKNTTKNYFRIKLCMFMTNFKVVGKKVTQFWSFYVLCTFGIKKSEIKNIFSICYFRIVQCTFMTIFEVIAKKMTKLWSFQVLSVFCIFCIEKNRNFKKKYFLKATLELGYVCS